MAKTENRLTGVKINRIQTNLNHWIYPDTNEPEPYGLHFNGYVWEYAFAPLGMLPNSPTDILVREWFHPSEGWA